MYETKILTFPLHAEPIPESNPRPRCPLPASRCAMPSTAPTVSLRRGLRSGVGQVCLAVWRRAPAACDRRLSPGPPGIAVEGRTLSKSPEVYWGCVWSWAVAELGRIFFLVGFGAAPGGMVEVRCVSTSVSSKKCSDCVIVSRPAGLHACFLPPNTGSNTASYSQSIRLQKVHKTFQTSASRVLRGNSRLGEWRTVCLGSGS